MTHAIDKVLARLNVDQQELETIPDRGLWYLAIFTMFVATVSFTSLAIWAWT